MKSVLPRIFAVFFFYITSLQIEAQKLAAIPYVSGINSPIDVKNCGDNRLFIAERAGRIRVINAEGTLRATPFLDFTSKISSTAGEEGFLGMTFSPNYKNDRKFYVDYTANLSGQLSTVVEEYKVSAADSNVADASSALTILTQSHQPSTGHMGGNLMFGKDGYLYINFGDGGDHGDPDGNGQNKNTYLGKILRIDVSKSSLAQPYVVPSSNPFYNDATPGIKKEIWAYGVRNPWRSSVDRLTGDLLIADVGEYKVEEIDFQNAGAAGGRNYGWNIVEGDLCYQPPLGCDKTGITLPVYEYLHNGGGASVTGGYVYRSAQSKSLWGQYIFADFVSKWIDAFRLSGGVVSGTVNHLITSAQATGNPISFGEDKYGDQYIVFNTNGTVYKLQDTSYLRLPKAYFSPIDQGGGSFLFRGLEGKNLTYQWLRNNVVIPGAVSPDFITSAPGTYTLMVTNTLNFTDISDAFTLGALPLSLTTFTAQKTSPNKIRLQWKTASEQNISGYTIMRRQNNEASFSNIGFVESKSVNGISNSLLDYSFTDSSVFTNSKLFYRLQIQNTDGSYTYSDIRTITTGGHTNIFTLFPNPAKDQVQIYLDNFTNPLVIVIYDNTGKKIKEQLLSQQNTTIKLSGLRGIYIVELGAKDGSNKVRKKLVVH